jgi:uncharacterized SAM-binding protein YcdF (DUF218 family)
MFNKLKLMALVDSDKLTQVDAIVLLTGDGYSRVDKVVSLFESNISDKIIISGGLHHPEEGSLLASVISESIKSKGVPKGAIIIDDESKNTYEQAQTVMGIAKEKNWNSIILVATHYHQYRAFLTFLKVKNSLMLNINLINSPVQGVSWFEETKSGRRIDLLVKEFHKIDEYQKKGHVASFEEGVKYFELKEKK